MHTGGRTDSSLGLGKLASFASGTGSTGGGMVLARGAVSALGRRRYGIAAMQANIARCCIVRGGDGAMWARHAAHTAGAVMTWDASNRVSRVRGRGLAGRCRRVIGLVCGRGSCRKLSGLGG